jgi:hypothetical protein
MAARLQRAIPIALMPAGAFAVHQLRYVLAYHHLAGAELARDGHAYLHSLVPWIVLMLAVTTGGFLRSLGRAFAGHRSPARYTISLTLLWGLCAAGLILIYVFQEWLEGLLATGHPAGWAGIFGYGGWWSIPAAAAVGLVLAASFHGALWVLREIAQRRRTPRLLSPRPVSSNRPPNELRLPRLAPLANGWSGRGPPH